MFIFTWYAFVYGMLHMQGVSSLVAEVWMVSSFVCLFVSIHVSCFVLRLHVLNSTHELLTNWNLIICLYLHDMRLFLVCVDMQDVSSWIAETWMVSSFICLFVSVLASYFVLSLHVLN